MSYIGFALIGANTAINIMNAIRYAKLLIGKDCEIGVYIVRNEHISTATRYKTIP